MPQTYTVGARSLFVTITAWVFIVVSLLACSSAVIQNAAVGAMAPAAAASAAEPLPMLTRFLVGYLPWVVGAGLVVSLATLGAAIGLLLRLDWARRAFIGLLVVAIAANLVGLWLQQEVVQSVVSTTLQKSPLPPQAADVFGGFVTASRAMGIGLTLVACAVLGWIIRRLMSPMIRQEFA